MLVLTRKLGKSIVIDDFLVAVMEIRHFEERQKCRTVLQFEQRRQLRHPHWKKTLAIEEEVSLNENGVDAVVKIIDICRDKVRIGVHCPKETPVHRKEVYDTIHGTGE